MKSWLVDSTLVHFLSSSFFLLFVVSFVVDWLVLGMFSSISLLRIRI